MRSLQQFLFRRVDNSPVILFRIFFGALMFCEGIGAILTGWVKETFVEPAFTFNFIGLDFLQVLVGPQMYAVYILISLLGIAIMIGWRYRLAVFLFTILWGATYLCQKSHYNNHYYLVWIVGMFLCIVPAHQYKSVDAGRIRGLESGTIPFWCIFIFQLQIAIVYFYAAVAKIYPDWLHANVIGLWLANRSYDTFLWGDGFADTLKAIFSSRPTHYLISFAGIFFDLLVVPAFLWKRTRTIALAASLIFHLTNSYLFEIGVFPYFAISMVVFFYPRALIRKKFFPRKVAIEETDPGMDMPSGKWLVYLLAGWFAVQLYLPLRHWRIPGDVLWTEEGHRLSWRMMLRSRYGYAHFHVVNTAAGISDYIKLRDYLSANQVNDVSTKPDMIWQFARKLEDEYRRNGDVDDVEIYVNARVSINGRTREALVDPEFDISAVPWKRFGHQEWLLPRPW